MRSQVFLDCMKNYNFTKARNIAGWQALRGGWEVWLQVEIAAHIASQPGFQQIEREVAYPNSHDRCDFKISLITLGHNDDTYIELKTMHRNVGTPLANLHLRFKNDIDKIESHKSRNYSCFALAAVYGRLMPAAGNREPIIHFGVENLRLRQYAELPYKSVFILIPGLQPIPIKADTTLTAADANDNLYLIAVSDNRV